MGLKVLYNGPGGFRDFIGRSEGAGEIGEVRQKVGRDIAMELVESSGEGNYLTQIQEMSLANFDSLYFELLFSLGKPGSIFVKLYRYPKVCRNMNMCFNTFPETGAKQDPNCLRADVSSY